MTNVNGSNWIRKEKRARIHARDKWTCVWCGKDLKDVPRGERTLDHVLARVAGGSNRASNLVTACLGCNSERQDLCAIDYAFGPLFARTGQKPWLVLNGLIECVCAELPPSPSRPPRVKAT
jgi:hypothetical protein